MREQLPCWLCVISAKTTTIDLYRLGLRSTRYSLHVDGPWCITFEWLDGDALRVDLEQYH